MVKMIDIAQLAGVSVATVSRVINKPELVDPVKREAVTAIIRETGFRPNALAKGLVSKSSKTIGVVINQFSPSYFGRMLDGVESVLFDANYKTIVESSRRSAQGEAAAVASLYDRQCEGIILHSDHMSDEDLRALLIKHPNLILMNRPVEGFDERCVYIDNIDIGYLAGNFLCEAGHKDIAVVTGPMTLFECGHRIQGFNRALSEHDMELNPELIFHSDFTMEGGHALMGHILTLKHSVSAVFFMNDQMAAGAIDMCLSNGVSVPDQVSILGCDDLEWASYLHPKLSTIRQPLDDLGLQSGALAYAFATQGDTTKHKRILHAEVKERASVRRL